MNLDNSPPCQFEFLKGVEILVVDNDLDSRDMYTLLLNHFGANVSTAGSIKEALVILEWLLPKIIVSEIRFLGESVYPLMKRLRAMEADIGNHIPIIVTSTCTLSSIDLMLLDFEKYLLKPLDLNQLVSTINNIVQAEIIPLFTDY